MKRLVIIGASGHGKVIADIALKRGYSDIVFLDDNTKLVECAGLPIAGTTSSLPDFRDADVIVAIGNSSIRKNIQAILGDCAITLTHPNAVISRRVEIGRGSVVMAGAVINSDVKIGEGCIINTCASVDHDCIVGDFAHISVGAHLAGTVTIGDGTWVGIGAAVSNNVPICSDCMIGAGAAVVNDIDVPGTYVGVPARRIS